MGMWTRRPKLSEQVSTIVLNYLKDRGLPAPEGDVDLESGLASFGLDSLDGVAIVTELESHFDLALDQNQAANARRLSDLVALVSRAQERFRRR